MKRFLVPLVLSAVLLFVMGGSAPATPLVAGEAGQIVVFADYDEWYMGFVCGAGYTIMDGVTVGGYYDSCLPAFGVFADLSLGPIMANGEIEFYEGARWGKVSACYAFDLEPLKLGVGFGSDFGSLGGTPFARAAADLAGGGALHLFAALDYYYDDDWVAYEAGLSLAF